MVKKGYKQTEIHKRKIRERNIGEKAYWYGKKQTVKSNLKRSATLKGRKPIEALKKLRELLPKGYWFGRKFTDEHKRKIGEAEKGEKHHAFNNWSSFEPYGKEFNKELKEKIRKKYQYRCQECFRHQDELRTKSNQRYKLSIHHIDYNKKNNSVNNLIPLCNPCHTQTNFGRSEWTNYFNEKKVVS